MRQSSFEVPKHEPATASQTASPRGESPARIAHWGSVLVALVAFVTLYRSAGVPSPVSVETSWTTPLSHAFAQGWQWGSEIISSYGPLGFLTPYFGWEAETATAFRIGQIVLAALSALLLFVFARGRSGLLQVILIITLLAWYPLLVMDIGWSMPFVFAVVLVHHMLDQELPGQPHRWMAVLIIACLTLLAMTSYNAMLMWALVMVYAAVAGAVRRDWRLVGIFSVISPVAFIAVWLTLGQSLSGLVDFITSAGDLSRGYAAMSAAAPTYVDLAGFAVLLLLAALLAVGCKLALAHLPIGLASVTLFALSFLAWRAGFVRADQHVLIFFGITSFVAIAALGLAKHQTSGLMGVRVALSGVLLVSGLAMGYGKLGVGWSLAGIPEAIAGLFQPDRLTLERQSTRFELTKDQLLPRTQARIGSKSVDVLMNEPSIALINKLNYRPRPAYLGYNAYTPSLTRINEAHLLSNIYAPDFLLIKLQSIDNRFPTADDPLSVIAAIREYLPIDVEGGYLVMQRTGWSIEPLSVPAASEWKVGSLGSDLVVDQGSKPQALFFDIKLNFWGRLRGALLREPGLSMHVKLTDGTEHSYSLVRRLGPAGMLVSPFMLTEADYLRWHASISERRVASMQLRATDLSDVRWFDPVFIYTMMPVELPRVPIAKLSSELKNFLYPRFSPAPINVETANQEVMDEGGAKVLFVHAPATLTFAPEPGVWSISGEFGLLSSAYDCQASDGVALIVERVAPNGKVTTLLTNAIDPVHKAADRGAQVFEAEPFSVDSGDRILVRSAPGLSENSGADCDWSYFGGITFAATPSR